MLCPECKFENPSGVKFCGGCGTRLEGLCLGCGHANPAQFRFCGECGRPLQASERDAAIDYSRPQSYTPKFLAEKILNQRPFIKGERKLLSVMFADVASFTSLSERVDPEIVHQIMDGCFRILLNETHRFEGTINQFTGDGIMALFGAPVAHEDHARRACHAALAIQQALIPYGEKLRERYGLNFQMRIGLNSGPVIVGAIGDDLRMDYTAVGDTTNLAARMEQMAQPGSILVSGNTHRLARDFFEFRALGRVKVKGKEEAQDAFELIGEGGLATRIEAAAARGLTRFVGRAEHLQALLENFEKACCGEGRVVEIIGEAGVGKSRLLLEFKDRLPKSGVKYVEGRCTRFGDAVAYLPIRQILSSYLQTADAEPEVTRRTKLAETVMSLDEKLLPALPALQDLLNLRVEDQSWVGLHPRDKKVRTFEAIRDLLRRSSRESPFVIAVEDIQWIDKSSEEFLVYLMGGLRDARILLVILRRPEYTPAWGDRPFLNRIGIGQLTREDSAELVCALLQDSPIASEIKDILYRQAGGNPLFMEELTRTFLEDGSVRKEDDRYFLARAVSAPQVPDTIQGIISARLDRLEARFKETVQTASVIGREFALRILQAISSYHGGLEECLSRLQDLDFICQNDILPDPGYIFKHALTQEVSYNSMLLGSRREIHEKIGNAIERLYPDRLEEHYEELAEHFSKGKSLEKAIKYIRLSAEKALRSNSLWVALRQYRELLQLLGQGPETDECKREKIAVLRSMVPILRELGFPEDPAEILQEGARLCKEIQDKHSMAIIHAYAGMAFTYRGDAALGSNFLEQAYEKAEDSGDLEILGELVFGLVPNYVIRGEFRKVVDVTSRVFRLFEQAHPGSKNFGMSSSLQMTLLIYGGLSMGFLGDFERGEGYCKDAVELALRTGHSFVIGAAELGYGSMLAMRGMENPAIEHLRSSIENYERSNGTIWLPSAWSYLGLAYSNLGDSAKALECLESALRMQNESELPALLSLHHCHVSAAYMKIGEYEKALFHAGKAFQLALDHGEQHHEALALMYMGLAEWKGRKAEIREADSRLREGISKLKELGIRPWEAQGHLYLGELLSEADVTAGALENLQIAEAMFLEMGMDSWLARTRKARALT